MERPEEDKRARMTQAPITADGRTGHGQGFLSPGEIFSAFSVFPQSTLSNNAPPQFSSAQQSSASTFLNLPSSVALDPEVNAVVRSGNRNFRSGSFSSTSTTGSETTHDSASPTISQISFFKPPTTARARHGSFACDRCYVKKVKCDASQPKCSNCVARKSECTYDRQNNPNFGSHRRKNLKSKQDLDNATEIFEPPKSKLKVAGSDRNIFPVSDPPLYPSYPGSNTINLNIPINIQFPPLNPNSHEPSISSINSIPFPAGVIDELLFAFFPNCNWPITVVHPKSYLANRTSRSKGLLYSICAIGAQFTEVGIQIAKPGEAVGESLFDLALGHLNYEIPTLDDACCVLLLTYFGSNAGKVNTMFYLSNIWRMIARKLKIWIDPDDPTAIPIARTWNLIQKETFRRLYWSCTGIGLHSYPNSSTKRPLPDHVWVSLTEDMYQGSPQYRPVQHLIESSDVHYVANETGAMLNLVRGIANLCKPPGSVNDLAVDMKAREVRGALDAWEHRIIIVSPLSPSPPSSRSQWLGIYVHISKHNIMLLAHRYLLVRFLEQVIKKMSPKNFQAETNIAELLNILAPQTSSFQRGITNTELPFLEETITRRNLEAEAFLACHKASNAVISILKDIVLKYDPLLENAHPSLTICLIQLCVFLGVLAQYAESEENRRKASENYGFVKVVLKNLANGNAKVAMSMVSALDEVEVKGWVAMKNFLLTFFSWEIGVDLNFEL
ncbi:hypothetical protein HK098_001972 [Nowakowskiella sp. JEL0407]|nr:hypothetical protein HK098_001972 [Nowakowskiella sp. JEL0407]